jgi:hypothetical protein
MVSTCVFSLIFAHNFYNSFFEKFCAAKGGLHKTRLSPLVSALVCAAVKTQKELRSSAFLLLTATNNTNAVSYLLYPFFIQATFLILVVSFIL